MKERRLTITMQPNWRAGLRAAAEAAKAGGYQGEVLNFETPGQFFGQFTEFRWNIIRAVQASGEIPVRELARLVDRDEKCVHEDVIALAELGLLETTDSGRLVCPYDFLHIDIHLKAA